MGKTGASFALLNKSRDLDEHFRVSFLILYFFFILSFGRWLGEIEGKGRGARGGLDA